VRRDSSALRNGEKKNSCESERQILRLRQRMTTKKAKQRQRRMRRFFAALRMTNKEGVCAVLVEGDVVGPGAVGGGVVRGAEAGEGVEVVGEVGLVVVAAGEGEFGPVDVGAAVHELDGLLEALDAAVEFGGDADLLAEELGEAAGADADVAGEGGDGGGAGGLLEAGERVVDGGGAALGFAFFAFAEAVAEGEVEEVKFLCWGGGFAEVVAEVLCGAAPEGGEVGFTVGEEIGVFGEEGCGAAGVEEDADEFAEVDGVDVLVARVDAEEDGGWSVLEGVSGVVGVGEVVAGE
jgi:hypothetical protein